MLAPFMVQYCERCQVWHWPAVPVCPECKEAPGFREVIGQGEVVAFTVVRRTPDSEWQARLPYLLAFVELSEGVRVMTNLVDCPPHRLFVGMPVEIASSALPSDAAVPPFKPLSTGVQQGK